MLIRCEFCGSSYDTATYPKCPNCGAESGKNSVVKEQIRYQNQADRYSVYNQMERDRYATDQARFNAEQEHLENERLKQRIKSEKTGRAISKGISFGCSLPFIIIGLLFATAIVFGVYNGLKEEGFFDTGTTSTTIVEETVEPTVPETPCEVKFKETAELSYCNVTCDKFEKIDPYPWNTAKNCEAYEIRLVIKNTTNKPIYFDSKILCIADGYQCKEMNKPFAMEQELRKQDVEGGLKTQGSICFEIPKDAKDVVLKYGDYITIKLK